MTVYKRKIKDIWVKMNKYSDYDFTVTAGYRTLAQLDCIGEAYRFYNSVNEEMISYLF